MRKLNYLLIALIMAAAPILNGCSDDDAPQLPSVQPGEILAKNLFVTIDGTFIFNREGNAQLTGTYDPNATEQHLQMTYPPMHIIYAKNTPTGDSLIEETPVFDITIKQESGKSLVTGSYEGNGYIISLSGELSVNYKGETDWNLEFTQEQTGWSYPYRNPFEGWTVEVELNSENIFHQRLHLGDDFEVRFKKMFNKILDAYKINSGYEAVRLSFVDECNYELWFKKTGEDEFVKDNLKHKYFITNPGYMMYLLDEVPYVKEQSKFLDLNCIGINFACGEHFFADDNTVSLPNSDTRYNVTRCQFKVNFEEWGHGYIFIERVDRKFFELFSPTGELGASDREFVEFREYEKDRAIHVEPSVKMTVVK